MSFKYIAREFYQHFKSGCTEKMILSLFFRGSLLARENVSSSLTQTVYLV